MMAVGMDGLTSFGFTYGLSHTQATWGDARRVSWPQMVEMLTGHVPGPKEGSCIVPALFTGDKRKKEEAAQIDVAFLDSDSGATLDEITEALRSKEWEAVVSSTHSHMTTLTAVSQTNWNRYFAKFPDATTADFLRDEKGYLSTISNGAEAVDSDDTHTIIQHPPCPKFRIALPLSKPWRASDYPNQAAANDAWKERIEALAAALSLSHDQACTDTSRLFYLPRRPLHGAVPETSVVSGVFCDIFGLPPAPRQDLFNGTSHVNGNAAPVTDNLGPLEHADPISGQYVNLTTWAKDSGRTFLIARALRERSPGKITGLIVDNAKVHIDCPNAGAHTNPGRDNATFVCNAGNAGTEGFVVHCRHGHCTGKDRLFFVRRMLEERWIEIDDLTADEFHISHAKTEPPKDIPGHLDAALPLVWFDEIETVLDARDFVQGVLVEQGSAVVYGESNAGKTFWTTDLALHVAAGKTWNGRRVEQGGVIYCVLEGGAGFRNRVAAWREAHSLTGIPFAAIPVSLNLLDPEADTQKLIEAIRAAAIKIGMPVKLVVIDTLSRAMAGGNENAPDDMGSLVKNMDRIRQEAGACLLFVHHSGKDAAKGARGHSLLRAAIDTEVEVVASETEEKAATIVKQRELKKGDVFGFRLKVVELGDNRHGEKVTTCIVEPIETEQMSKAVTRRKVKLSPGATLGVRALSIAMSKGGAILPPRSEYPSGMVAVSALSWREEFYQLKAGSQDANKHAFSRAETEMLAANIITARNGFVWFVKRRDDEP